MMTQKRALLLVGSPKGAKSTSESLGTYLLDRLQERGLDTATVRIYAALKSDKSREDLLLAINRADVVILACPLYVDSPPSAVIKAMELIARHRRVNQEPKKQWLLAISNCGFPEAHQNDTALAIYRRFAQEAGFEWAEGLALGTGPAIDGKPLNEAGGMVRNVTRSLDLTAAALAEGKAAPQEAVDLIAKPLVPSWVYVLFGGMGWKKQAKEHGAQKKLLARPY